MTKATEVSFDISLDDQMRVRGIVRRAVELGLVKGHKAKSHWYTATTANMDLTAAHANGCPIDFERLLKADDFNFTHDIAGIARHIDRDTGRLGNFFRPRFAQRNEDA